MLQLITGIALAGGNSTRLGQDKALLPAQGHRSYLGHTCALLAQHCHAVFISAPKGRFPQLSPLGLPYAFIADELALQDGPFINSLDSSPQACSFGPIAGICASLHRTGTPCLVLACDMPNITSHHLTQLLALRNPTKAMTAYQGPISTKAPKLQCLCAIYEPHALPLLQAALNKNQRSLFRAIANSHVETIPYGAEEVEGFLNINYPEDII